MNSKQIQDLTVLLSHSLDQNYDVLNMDAVLTVISALENATITKEQLEVTRLAKYINQLRRRTDNDELARRAKNLLKKWRAMVGIQRTPDCIKSPTLTTEPSPQIIPINKNSSQNAEIDLPDYIQKCKSPEKFSKNVLQEYMAFSTINSSTEKKNMNAYVEANTKNSNNKSKSTNHVVSDQNDSSHNFGQGELTQNLIKPKMLNQKSTDVIGQSNFENHTDQSFIPRLSNIVPQKNQETIIINIQDSDSDSDIVSLDTLTDTKPAKSLKHSQTSKKKHKKYQKRKEKNGKNQQFDVYNELTHGDQCNETKSESGHLISMASEVLTLSDSSFNSGLCTTSSIVGGNIFCPNSPNINENNQKATHVPNRYSVDLTFSGLFQNQNNLHKNSGTESIEKSLDVVSDVLFPCTQGDFNRITTSCNIFENTNDASFRNDSLMSDDNQRTRRSDSKYNIRQYKKRTKNISDSLYYKKESTFSNKMEPHLMSDHRNYNDNAVENIDNLKQSEPKKRGRKRGSKGVDSLISQESSLSSKILTSLGGKKVKTTKELFAEMQFKKFGCTSTVASSPPANCFNSQMSASGSNSASSGEIRGSETDSNTSPSSLTVKYNRVVPNSSDSNSISLVQENDTPVSTSIVRKSLDSVEAHLQVLLKKLPPVNYFDKLNIQLKEDDNLCSCKIIEYDETSSNFKASNSKETSTDYSESCLAKHKLDLDEFSQKIVLDIETQTKIEETQNVQSSLKKTFKSIFDPDSDDDGNALQSIELNNRSDQTYKFIKNPLKFVENNTNLNFEKIHKTDNAHHFPCNENSQELSRPSNNLVKSNSLDYKKYKIEEDPECEARNRYILQMQKITKFHVQALHSCYIENINGNWDEIGNESRPEDSFFSSNRNEDLKICDKIVPKFGTLADERISKVNNISRLHCSAQSRTVTKSRVLLPFFGVARKFKKQKKVKISNEISNELSNNHAKCDSYVNNNLISLAKENTNIMMPSIQSISDDLLRYDNTSTSDVTFTTISTTADRNHQLPKDMKRKEVILASNQLHKAKKNKRYLEEQHNVSVLASPKSSNLDGAFEKNQSILLGKQQVDNTFKFPIESNYTSLKSNDVFAASSPKSPLGVPIKTDNETKLQEKNVMSNSMLEYRTCKTTDNQLFFPDEIHTLHSNLSITSSTTLNSPKIYMADIDCDMHTIALQSNQSNQIENQGRILETGKDKTENNVNEPQLLAEKTNSQFLYDIEESNSNEDISSNRQMQDVVDELPKDNNGLFASFNKLELVREESALFRYDDITNYKGNAHDSKKNPAKGSEHEKIISVPFQNVDLCTDLNSHGMVKNEYNICEKLPFHENVPEYYTGYRRIGTGNCSSGIGQEFKEWHQILQQRSYNDEVITILPYVVLD